MKKYKEPLQEESKELKYVFEQLIKRNYTVLPETISEGIVLKIHLEGNLETDGYEKGYLVLTPNSGILEHTHTNDIEKYINLSGIMSIKNKQEKENICEIGKTHNIDKTQELTIIKTIKISKKTKIKTKTLFN